MPTVKGRSEVKAAIARTRVDLEKVLRGAARVAAKVVADEAKDRSVSDVVGEAIVVRPAQVKDGRITVKITVKPGWAYARALWLELGTSPHFISVDDSQREGMGLGRINQKVKEADGKGSLVIHGKFVGATVFHPGAQPHPFLRPAMDIKEGEAIAAAQRYINARVGPAGITGTSDIGDDDT